MSLSNDDERTDAVAHVITPSRSFHFLPHSAHREALAQVFIRECERARTAAAINVVFVESRARESDTNVLINH